MINPIFALSPLDGRYAQSVEDLRPIFFRIWFNESTCSRGTGMA